MKLPWQPKDYLFSICITLGMVITVFTVPRFAPEKLEILCWAPFGGLFLTLGMAKLRYRGSVLLMLLPLILVVLLRSPLIAGYLTLTGLCTEIVGVWQGHYGTRKTRLWAILTFFISATLLAVVSAGLFIGGKWLTLLSNPLLVTGITIGASVSSLIGWGIGELIWKK